MNKKELQELMKKHGLTDDKVIDAIADEVIVSHGKDIEAHKAKVTTLETENTGLKTQLGEANKQIETFKGMKIEDVQKAADEWKKKAETAQTESATQIATLKFDHALEGALLAAKVKNPKTVRPLLNEKDLKLGEDGAIVGLAEQLEKLKGDEANAYLFSSEEKGKPAPKIVAGAKTNSVITDPIVDAARKAAGLAVNEGK